MRTGSFSLIYCLPILLLVVAPAQANPNSARTTASISARILEPVRLSVTASSAHIPGKIHYTGRQSGVFQLSISNSESRHSYETINYPFVFKHNLKKRTSNSYQKPDIHVIFD